jgi:hypothetical protein
MFIDIKIEVEVDEPADKVKKRVQHMISKWPLLSPARIFVTAEKDD